MNDRMIAKSISWICLVLVGLPSVLSYLGWMDLNAVQWLALVGSVGWFIATPLWMGREAKSQNTT
jgi:hypothetical protein